MIVIGYQGIGKTTLCKRYGNRKGFIDLESSLLKDPFNDNKRPDNWAEIYCRIALSLSGQGYTVFVSSHKIVQDILEHSLDQVVAIYPDKELKDEWLKKLFLRMVETGVVKDKIAYLDAKENWDEEIDILENSPFVKAHIPEMNYNLLKTVRIMRKMLDESNWYEEHSSHSKQAAK